MIASPMPDLARLFLHEQVGDHAQAVAGAERLDDRGAEAEHDVVDGADDEQRVVAFEQGAVRVVERFGPRFALQPDRAALHHRQLRAHHVRKLDDPRDVVLAGGPAGFHVS